MMHTRQNVQPDAIPLLIAEDGGSRGFLLLSPWSSRRPCEFRSPFRRGRRTPSARPALTAIWLGYAGTGDGGWTAIATVIRTIERTLAFLRTDTRIKRDRRVRSSLWHICDNECMHAFLPCLRCVTGHFECEERAYPPTDRSHFPCRGSQLAPALPDRGLSTPPSGL